MRRALVSTILLLTIITTMPLKAESKGEEMVDKKRTSPLLDKPSFNIRISCEGAAATIAVNGVDAYMHDSLAPLEMEKPVNNLIADGENELQIVMLNPATGLTPDSVCSVTLFVRRFNDFENPPQDIVTLRYRHGVKEPLKGTTRAGRYDSTQGFREDEKRGDVKVGSASFRVLRKGVAGTKYKGMVLATLKFHMPAPFPRWKFLDAPKVFDKTYEEHSKEELLDLMLHDPKLAKLYEVNHALYRALKEKDMDRVMSFFKERNDETDIAFYSKPGSTEKKLREALIEALNDKEQALDTITWDNKKTLYFSVDIGRALAGVQGMIVFNSIGYPGSHTFYTKFRWDEKRQTWILTR